MTKHKDTKALEAFIRRVKFAATMHTNFDEFFTFVHSGRFDYKKHMAKNEFDRLVSVASIEANLY
jgi:hypothetical protein